MKKVGNGTIPMPYPMWKEMHDRVMKLHMHYDNMKTLLGVQKKIVDQLPNIPNNSEIMRMRMDYVAMVMVLEQSEAVLEDMDNRFNKYYSFEPEN